MLKLILKKNFGTIVVEVEIAKKILAIDIEIVIAEFVLSY